MEPLDQTLPAIDWDAPGLFSIVLQGGCSAGNIVETANHATHWRSLFPQAEIVFAISVTDLLETVPEADGKGGVRLTPLFAENGLFQVALRQLQTACDCIVISAGALPFPPLKRDGHGANNANLQIVAAQAGLAAATGRYVLRVRSDLVFQDRAFLGQYEDCRGLPRGDAAVLAERVLVSWLYTLNPYTIERMPFHVSDWFHLGLTADVRRIWNVPPMSFADASYHKINAHPDEANALERMIVPRLAVEQHILFHSMKPSLPELTLASCVDWSARDRSIDVLVDNFVICDVELAHCLFDKYAFDFTNPARLVHCVTRDDWLRMADCTGEDRRDVLLDKVRGSERAEKRPFPRSWSARALHTKQGSRSVDSIVAMPHGGVLLHGPYDRVPSGRYVARLETSACLGPGKIMMRVTLDEGVRVLAERTLTLGTDGGQVLEVPFDILSGVGTDLELVCEIEGAPRLIITGLVIAERPETGFVPVARYDTAIEPMLRRFGREGPNGISTERREGHLLFGPSIVLSAGSYRARFALCDVREPGDAKIEVATEVAHSPEQQLVAVEPVAAAGGTDANTCLFELPDRTGRVEFRIWVTDRSAFTAREIVLERR